MKTIPFIQIKKTISKSLKGSKIRGCNNDSLIFSNVLRVVLYFILTSSFLGLVGRRGLGGFDGWSLEPLSNKRTSLLKVNLNLGLEMPERRRVAEICGIGWLHMEFICLLLRLIDRTIPIY